MALSLSSITGNQALTSQKVIAAKGNVEPIVKRETAVLKRQASKDFSALGKAEASPNKVETVLPLTIEEELLAARLGKSYIPENAQEQVVNTTMSLLKEYGVYMSGKELLSTIIALLLGLLLIRYRREIYSYTNISYDHPKYYPPFDEATAKEALKERPITFHDTIVNTHKDTAEFSGKLIEECEELAEELIDDLNIKENSSENNTDWDILNKACDDYIAEYKNENTIELSDFDNKTNENFESEEMTFELFEALAEGIATKDESIQTDNNDEALI